MSHPPTIFDTLTDPLTVAAIALVLAAALVTLRATARRRRGPVADVLDHGAPNAGEIDVLVIVDVSHGATSATPVAATGVLGPRIRRLTLAFLTGSPTPGPDVSDLVAGAVEPVEVFRPAVLLVHGDAGAAATRLVGTGAYDVAVVAEDFDSDTTAAFARRTGTPVLRVKEPDRPAVSPALTTRGSRP